MENILALLTFRQSIILQTAYFYLLQIEIFLNQSFLQTGTPII